MKINNDDQSSIFKYANKEVAHGEFYAQLSGQITNFTKAWFHLFLTLSILCQL